MKKQEKTKKKVDLGKVGDVVKKVPAFLRRMQSELAKLKALIEKAQAFVDKLASLPALNKDQKVQKRLLEKQVKAMKAYEAALQARIDNESARV